MSTIFVLSAFIGFLAIIFFFRKIIYSVSLKCIFGPYHEKYVFLSKHDIAYQSAYYIKGEISNQIQQIKRVSLINKKSTTNKQLLFQNMEYGINSKKLASLLGKPDDTDILFMGNTCLVTMEYNIQPNNIIDKYIFYFYKDKYYYGEFIFNKIKEQTSNQILENINTKYTTSYDQTDELLIEDQNENILFYKDYGFRISVSYFNRNNPEINKLISLQQTQIKDAKTQYEYHLNIQELSF